MRAGGRISITESYFMMLMKFIYYACLAVVILMAVVFCVSVLFIWKIHDRNIPAAALMTMPDELIFTVAVRWCC
ncbi:hypothetical protein AU28_24810 [Salmonella enterica subsp. enterica serovar Enteritidis str. EC20110355]|nr:hypothetical protein AU28_24810 [Salmonella enterica subsp. enterica serovar Enteritidis str. EC20110355]